MNTVYQIVDKRLAASVILGVKISPPATLEFCNFMNLLIVEKGILKDVIIEWNLDFLLNIGLIKSGKPNYYLLNSDKIYVGKDSIKTIFFNTKPNQLFNVDNFITYMIGEINVITSKLEYKIKIERILF
jgi:hypothetical protein